MNEATRTSLEMTVNRLSDRITYHEQEADEAERSMMSHEASAEDLSDDLNQILADLNDAT